MYSLICSVIAGVILTCSGIYSCQFMKKESDFLYQCRNYRTFTWLNSAIYICAYFGWGLVVYNGVKACLFWLPIEVSSTISFMISLFFISTFLRKIETLYRLNMYSNLDEIKEKHLKMVSQPNANLLEIEEELFERQQILRNFLMKKDLFWDRKQIFRRDQEFSSFLQAKELLISELLDDLETHTPNHASNP